MLSARHGIIIGTRTPQVPPPPEITCQPRSRGEDRFAVCGRKSQGQAQLQPQPQLRLCRHCHHYRQGLNNALIFLPTTTSTTTSSPSPSYPTNPTLDSDQSIELVTRPETAYLSPHRALPSFESLSSPSSIALNECCAPSNPQSTSAPTTMGLSKTQRIGILLAIDSAFFLVELVIGEWHCYCLQSSHTNSHNQAMLYTHSPSSPIHSTCSTMYCPFV